MTDLSDTVLAKSEQLTADDLLGRDLTIKVTGVSRGNGEQPICINFEGDGGKPYYPCKSMRRVLINVWTQKGDTYVGKSMTLFRDPKVKFGGIEVGGIRISHMSGITAPVTMALTETKAKKKPYVVKPLVLRQAVAQPAASSTPRRTAAEFLDDLQRRFEAVTDRAAFDALVATDDVQRAVTNLRNGAAKRLDEIINAAEARVGNQLENAEEDDGWPGPQVEAA